MCRELVAKAIDDERMMKLLQIPRPFWNWIAASFKRERAQPLRPLRPALRRQGAGQAAGVQRRHADRGVRDRRVPVAMAGGRHRAQDRCPKDADQYNSLHERLIEGWKVIGKGRRLLSRRRARQRRGRRHARLHRGLRAAGRARDQADRDERASARRGRGGFVDLDNKPIELMFKLYPWEWMMREAFGASLPGAPTQFVEPPWKAILSNKAILPLLWAMFPNHPNLLPAYFEGDAKAAELGTSYVRKPLYSREGANVELVVDGKPVDQRRRALRRRGLHPPGHRAAAAVRRQLHGARAPGLPPASLAGSTCARTRARSPRTRRAFCRTPSSDRWIAPNELAAQSAAVSKAAR